ncbi:hypothetical protein [Planctellipticum variicoloris]|uniref:hypothetical protein n=1 Tax=Planctellipticum variicoloris TaxID=3064265 RepID=UPI002BACB45F|nr:hypothetical protein SH412_001635 [Planctomycetaceae bacterium SH412]HTN00421.1 hypothetical protein [Planctomycetaceae bacterium]
MEIAVCQELCGKSPLIGPSDERAFHAMDRREFELEELEVEITKSIALRQADLAVHSFQRVR